MTILVLNHPELFKVAMLAHSTVGKIYIMTFIFKKKNIDIL